MLHNSLISILSKKLQAIWPNLQNNVYICSRSLTDVHSQVEAGTWQGMT